MTEKTTNYDERVYVDSPGKLPEGDHYALIESTSTDDGWGGRQPAILYTAFLTRAEWEWEIQQLIKRPHTSFRAIVVKPAKVETVVKIGE